MQVAIYTTRRSAGKHICLEIWVIETVVRHCAFCKLKVLCATTLAYMKGNIYFFIPESARAFRWQPPAGAPRSFVFVYRLDCCSRDKMSAREKSRKWSFAHSHRDSSFNSGIKLNDRDAESKNHKRDRIYSFLSFVFFKERSHYKKNAI